MRIGSPYRFLLRNFNVNHFSYLMPLGLVPALGQIVILRHVSVQYSVYTRFSDLFCGCGKPGMYPFFRFIFGCGKPTCVHVHVP